MQNIAANPIGESIVWDYVRENWENMVARFGLNERYLGRMIPSICGRFSTKTKLDEVCVSNTVGGHLSETIIRNVR